VIAVGSPVIGKREPKSVLMGVVSYEHSHKCRSLQRRSKTSWTNWKRQSSADCVPGRPSSGYEPFSRILAKARFRTGPEDIRCRGRNPGTRFEKIPAPPERGDQEPVFFGSPLPGRHDQGRMQKRLSSRSSGIVESVGSGRGPDSELSACENPADELSYRR
jgi:hypothetical protein